MTTPAIVSRTPITPENELNHLVFKTRIPLSGYIKGYRRTIIPLRTVPATRISTPNGKAIIKGASSDHHNITPIMSPIRTHRRNGSSHSTIRWPNSRKLLDQFDCHTSTWPLWHLSRSWRSMCFGVLSLTPSTWRDSRHSASVRNA